MVNYFFVIYKVEILIERIDQWQSVKIVEKQPLSGIIAVFQCARPTASSNQTCKKSPYMKMV